MQRAQGCGNAREVPGDVDLVQGPRGHELDRENTFAREVLDHLWRYARSGCAAAVLKLDIAIDGEQPRGRRRDADHHVLLMGADANIDIGQATRQQLSLDLLPANTFQLA